MGLSQVRLVVLGWVVCWWWLSLRRCRDCWVGSGAALVLVSAGRWWHGRFAVVRFVEDGCAVGVCGTVWIVAPPFQLSLVHFYTTLHFSSVQ